ncbi:hypothetical protein PHLGIDRAFT_124367 [Phlebiopsis gigantea 11061_1 CR5-6]|uniref:Uncharacterized protein n=1 Tax=Phlebiopsis gigantea (strain 11061_1 CR5-6) TaxID=745531 RepID=A0A0C3S749_PHLG1|nr:hypothetical protein PHLGIDRAFT_124367 [Phlebiopsis gigantea 11061_1 CR5-6]
MSSPIVEPGVYFIQCREDSGLMSAPAKAVTISLGVEANIAGSNPNEYYPIHTPSKRELHESNVFEQLWVISLVKETDYAGPYHIRHVATGLYMALPGANNYLDLKSRASIPNEIDWKITRVPDAAGYTIQNVGLKQHAGIQKTSAAIPQQETDPKPATGSQVLGIGNASTTSPAPEITWFIVRA